MVIVTLRELPILGKVVQPHDLMSVVEKLLNEIPADEAGGASDEKSHENPKSQNQNPKSNPKSKNQNPNSI
jgi:hypothetical protein